MSKKMTKEAARRLYVETDRNASYTGLPQATIDAHEDILDELEHRHPGIRRHAVAAAPRHFDRPLDHGTRAHQEHMRSEDGMQQADVEATQREMDGTPPKAPRPPREAPASPGGGNPRPNSRPASPARRVPSSSSSARRGGGVLAGVRGARGRARGVAALGGSWGLYAYKVLEWGIGLSVLVLILTKSESKPAGQAPLELLFGGLSTVLKGLVSTSVDPLSPHAKPAATHPAPAAVTGRARTKTPAAKARPALTAAKTPLGAVAK